jgi:hypothetical protein
MKVVDLVLRSSLLLKQSQSYVGKSARLSGTSGEVFSLHKSIIGGGGAERDTIAIVVRTHAGETGAPANLAFEMKNV